MRQFIIYSTILSGVILGYFAFRDSITLAPNIGTPSVAVAKAPTTSQNLNSNKVKSSNKVRKVTKHESKRHQSTPNAQRPRSGEDEGSSISADEIKSITSIYQDQEREQPESQPGSSLTAESELPKSQPRSPIPGVKVAAWVRSKQDHLNTDVPDPRIGAGMRVFVNCVELKEKGASPLERADCERVLAKKESVTRASWLRVN